MKKTLPFLIAMLILALAATSVFAGSAYPWRDHAAPYDFTFGNHIDANQQSKQVGKDKLGGFLYIRYTGGETVDGVPLAKHGNCNVDDDCIVGWKLHGIAAQAQYCRHSGGHPTWAISPEEMPKQPGYTHFHWLNQSPHAGGLEVGKTYDGYVLKLTTRDHFFFDHHGGFDITPGIDYQSHANIVPPCSS